MRTAVFFSLALAAVISACGPTPSEAGNRAEPGATVRAENNPADSAAARGGNLMGSGH